MRQRVVLAEDDVDECHDISDGDRPVLVDITDEECRPLVVAIGNLEIVDIKVGRIGADVIGMGVAHGEFSGGFLSEEESDAQRCPFAFVEGGGSGEVFFSGVGDEAEEVLADSGGAMHVVDGNGEGVDAGRQRDVLRVLQLGFPCCQHGQTAAIGLFA